MALDPICGLERKSRTIMTRQKNLTTVICIAMAALLAACTLRAPPARAQSQEATQASVQDGSATSVAPSQAPTEPTAEPDLATQMVGIILQWSVLVETNPASQSVVPILRITRSLFSRTGV